MKILPRTIFKGTFKLQVTKHTTDFKGPAMIGLSPELWFFVHKYIHLIRRLPNFVFKISDSIFLKWPSGGKPPQPLDNSALSKCLSRLWNKIFGSNKPISTTRLRKAVVTEVRRAVPHSRDVLAKHMCHEPATADKYYHMADKSKMAVPVSRLITAVM